MKIMIYRDDAMRSFLRRHASRLPAVLACAVEHDDARIVFDADSPCFRALKSSTPSCLRCGEEHDTRSCPQAFAGQPDESDPETHRRRQRAGGCCGAPVAARD